MVFANAASAVVQGNQEAFVKELQADPGIVTEEDAYDEVMEAVDSAPGGIAMAPVVGTLLHLAANYGRVDMARMLLDNGAEANRMETVHWHDVDIERRTPLHLAIWCGSVEMVQLLVERRADISMASGPVGATRTPLEVAISRSYTDITRCLLAAPSTSSADSANVLHSLLFRAIQSQNTETVEMLLEKKAQVNRAFEGGAFPLHIAAKQASPDIVSMLLARGADASQEEEGCMPLLSIAANAKAQFAEWVELAPPGPERDWRVQMQEQHLELVKNLLGSGALQAAPSSLRHVLDMFGSLDVNGDGTIERDELKAVLGALDGNRWTDERVDQMLKAADANHDGKIQLDEFLQWIFKSGGMSPKA